MCSQAMFVPFLFASFGTQMRSSIDICNYQFSVDDLAACRALLAIPKMEVQYSHGPMDCCETPVELQSVPYRIFQSCFSVWQRDTWQGD